MAAEALHVCFVVCLVSVSWDGDIPNNMALVPISYTLLTCHFLGFGLP